MRRRVILVPRLYIRGRGFAGLQLETRRGFSGFDAFTAVTSTIQQLEGFYPGSISYRLNNPGNLMYAGQPGATPVPIVGSDGKTRTFASWPTLAQGEAALDAQVTLDASRGETIAQFAAKYAPAQDANDPASYAAAIAAAGGVSVNSPLSMLDDTVLASVPPPAPDLPAALSDLVSSSSFSFDPITLGLGAVVVGALVAAFAD